jgi:hypothetical protein
MQTEGFSRLRTHLDQCASAVLKITVANPGGCELGEHRQDEGGGERELHGERIVGCVFELVKVGMEQSCGLETKLS